MAHISTELFNYQNMILRKELLLRCNATQQMSPQCFIDEIVVLLRSHWYAGMRNKVYSRILIYLELLTGNRVNVSLELRKRNEVTWRQLQVKKNKKAREKLRQKLQKWRFSALYSISLRFHLILQFLFILKYNIRYKFRVRKNVLSLKRSKTRIPRVLAFYSRKLRSYFLMMRKIRGSFFFHKLLNRKTPLVFALIIKMKEDWSYPRFFFFISRLFNIQFKLRLSIWKWGKHRRRGERSFRFYIKKLHIFNSQQSQRLSLIFNKLGKPLSRLRKNQFLWRSKHAENNNLTRFRKNFFSKSRKFLVRRIVRGLWKLRVRKYRRKYIQFYFRERRLSVKAGRGLTRIMRSRVRSGLKRRLVSPLSLNNK